ncbi:hypothetical protein HZH66_003492 [Vespula vulgaris]|uniref:Uncharacterized protein n=1 Tax=Vespula vulgaris TaxID=7454 RepID=A0A834KD72_VESVU|nr:hypothetical protein HZH66_003492 [Vespula vulgaris]
MPLWGEPSDPEVSEKSASIFHGCIREDLDENSGEIAVNAEKSWRDQSGARQHQRQYQEGEEGWVILVVEVVTSSGTGRVRPANENLRRVQSQPRTSTTRIVRNNFRQCANHRSPDASSGSTQCSPMCSPEPNDLSKESSGMRKGSVRLTKGC